MTRVTNKLRKPKPIEESKTREAIADEGIGCPPKSIKEYNEMSIIKPKARKKAKKSKKK